ncbi:LOW QUALITY PROTEIN: hypothetical protein HJC23_010472, partial [Cyclotella cryptica]
SIKQTSQAPELSGTNLGASFSTPLSPHYCLEAPTLPNAASLATTITMEKPPREGGNITILVLGDEGVGKSSLVSTFVSRHFSELVPGILTRVRLPPDPLLSNCTSTIIDTQQGDAALTDALSLSGALGSQESPSSIHSSGSTDTISSGDKSQTANAEGIAAASHGIDASRESTAFVLSPKKDRDEMRAPTTTASSPTTRPPAATVLAATSPYRNVDAIILVYDLDRAETFYRLESHWLPLIEKCYNGEMPVIIAGNKMDLLHPSSSVDSASDNEYFVRSRQEIIALLQRFMFVRQFIKCSARNLLNIDEVFRKAQQSVLYPIIPLYDLNTGRLTSACSRALTRIFRIFDRDRDGLLSDSELNAFQHEVWGVNLMERDFSYWKKVVMEHDSSFQTTEGSSTGSYAKEDVVRNGKFTLAGFLTIFDVFMSQNRLEVPWKVLRKFGYDDQLNLVIPSSMSEGDDFITFEPKKWKLDSAELSFLANLFHQFDSDGDGILASGETRSIFSVVPNSLPPWSERRRNLFRGCLSVPRIEEEGTSPASSMVGVQFDPSIEMSPLPASSPSSDPSSPSIMSASGLTITSSPLPSISVSEEATLPSGNTVASRPLSYFAWMNHWHMLCTISPSICRAELYRLGNVYEVKGSESYPCHSHITRPIPRPTDASSRANIPSIIVRALIIGSRESGSAALTRKLHGEKCLNEFSTLDSLETSCSVSKILWPPQNSDTEDIAVETILHLIVTEVPLDTNTSATDISNQHKRLSLLLGEGVYDMAVLVYNLSSERSFDLVKQFEDLVLNDNMPRIFVGTTTDSTKSVQLPQAIDHCKVMDLEPPCIVTIGKSQTDPGLINVLVCCAKHRRRNGSVFRSTPHGEYKRRKAANKRKLLWFGGIVTAGITVVIGLTICRKKKGGTEKSWLKSLFAFVSY